MRSMRMKIWLWLSLLCGCSSGGAGGDPPGGARDLAVPLADAGVDLASGGVDLRGAPVDLAARDLAPAMPTDADCYYGWKTLGTCPAPQITESYLSNNCAGTTGVFVIGRYFQSANSSDSSAGPYALSPKLNRNTWNFLSPRMACITTSADTSYWTGFSMQVKNPDGQTSNSVTVQSRLGARPPLPSSGSKDPFDPNACFDAGMTKSEALARFMAGSSTTTLGMMTLSKRSRPCNMLTGCAAWGSATTEASGVPAGLAIGGGGSTVQFNLGGRDCGVLGSNDYTITQNSCPTTGAAGSYSVHVASACLMLWHSQRSTVAGDGSYTQTDYGGVLRY